MKNLTLLLLIVLICNVSFAQENNENNLLFTLIQPSYLDTDVSHVSSTIDKIADLDEKIKSKKDDYRLFKDRGKAFYDINFLYAALNDFKSVLKLAPLDGEAHFYVADIYFKNKNLEGAILHYKKAREIGYEPEQMTLNIFLTHSFLLQTEEAEKMIPELSERDQFSIVNFYCISGQFDKAKAYLETHPLDEFDPLINGTLDIEDIYGISVNGCIRDGMYEHGINLIEQMAQENTVSNELKILKADCYLKLGKFNEAEYILNEVISNSDKEIIKFYSHYKLAGTYDWSGRPLKASEEYQKALKIRPNDEATMNDLSIVYDKIQDNENRIKYIRKVFDINPENLDNTNRLGIYHKEHNNLDSALFYYHQSYSIAKGYHRTLYNLSGFELEHFNFDESLMYSYKSLSAESHYYYAMGVIQDISYGLNKLDLACRILKEQSFQIKNDLSTIKSICQYCGKEDREDLLENPTYQTYQDYLHSTLSFDSAVIARSPNSVSSHMSYARINYESLKNFDAAIQSIDHLLTIETGQEADLYQMKGTMHDVWIPNPQKAIENYTKALELNPDYTLCYQKRAREYVKTDQHELAIADFKKFLASNLLGESQIALANIELVKLYQKTNNNEALIKSADIALNHAPYNRVCLNALINVGEGTESHSLENVKQRLNQLNQFQ